MVRLEEVEDEAFTSDQPGPIEEEADWESDEGKTKKHHNAIHNPEYPHNTLQNQTPPPSPPTQPTTTSKNPSTTASPLSKMSFHPHNDANSVQHSTPRILGAAGECRED